jgi:protein-S-isoprenylcysteine O-methyltransferase Ste14
VALTIQQPKLVVFSVVSILIYLGLASLGEGSIAAFITSPPLLAFVIITIAFTVLSMFTEGNISSGEQEDRSNRWVILAFMVLGFVTAFVAPYTDRIDFWTIGGDTTRWIGIAVLFAGSIMRIAPVFVLGKRFSGLVAIQPGHRLVTTGLYSVIRHPSYVGLMLGALGFALTFRSGIGVILALLNLVPLMARIRSEERLLAAQFGEEYEAWRRHTWRLVPGIW